MMPANSIERLGQGILDMRQLHTLLCISGPWSARSVFLFSNEVVPPKEWFSPMRVDAR
jgi:hypothetical protein